MQPPNGGFLIGKRRIVIAALLCSLAMLATSCLIIFLDQLGILISVPVVGSACLMLKKLIDRWHGRK